MLSIGSLTACATSSPQPGVPARTQPAVVESPPAPDFTLLRTQYGERKDFFAVCERNRPLKRIFELLEQKNWSDALATSSPWLESCPVDIDAHVVAAIALKELGRTQESEHHVRWFRGLVDSIFASGDGHTPQTAFVVISISEEYSVLRVLRMRRTSQRLLQGGIDALDVTDAKGVPSVIYFNPAAHFRRMQEYLPTPK